MAGEGAPGSFGTPEFNQAARLNKRVYTPPDWLTGKLRTDGFELWPDPLADMPEDGPHVPSPQCWTPERWQVYMMRHQGKVWWQVHEEIGRNQATINHWMRNLRVRYGGTFCSRVVKSPESARNIPGYARTAMSEADEARIVAIELREIMSLASEVLTKSLRLKLQDDDFMKAMSPSDLKQIAGTIEAVGRRYDALADGGSSVVSLTPAKRESPVANVNIFAAIDEKTVSEANQQTMDLRTALQNFKELGTGGQVVEVDEAS